MQKKGKKFRGSRFDVWNSKQQGCVGAQNLWIRGQWHWQLDHTMASMIQQLAYDELDAPPTVVGARNWITPPGEMEEAFFPQPSDMLDAIHTHIVPLPGYEVARTCDVADKIRREKRGV